MARVIDTIHAVRDIIVHLHGFALDYLTLGSKHYVSASLKSVVRQAERKSNS